MTRMDETGFDAEIVNVRVSLPRRRDFLRGLPERLRRFRGKTRGYGRRGSKGRIDAEVY